MQEYEQLVGSRGTFPNPQLPGGPKPAGTAKINNIHGVSLNPALHARIGQLSSPGTPSVLIVVLRYKVLYPRAIGVKFHALGLAPGPDLRVVRRTVLSTPTVLFQSREQRHSCLCLQV